MAGKEAGWTLRERLAFALTVAWACACLRGAVWDESPWMRLAFLAAFLYSLWLVLRWVVWAAARRAARG